MINSASLSGRILINYNKGRKKVTENMRKLLKPLGHTRFYENN